MNDTMENTDQERNVRLAQVLEQLAVRGVKQQAVAQELNIPTQYLSDLKHGRRPVSEQFARRFAEVFQIRAVWLLHGEGASEMPNLAAAPAQTAGSCLLPVLSDPDQGEPRHSPYWDGSMITLSGAAAAAAERAKLPFVLRLGVDIPSGRLRKNDLVLCCQELRKDAAIQIVRTKGKAVLAQRDGKDRFKTCPAGNCISGGEPVGYCIGIVWAPL
jgi:transcriptional regulator with XRE-family HTH domain